MSKEITPEECADSDGLVVIKRDEKLSGWVVKAEGSSRLSRLQMAGILASYAQHILEDVGARN